MFEGDWRKQSLVGLVLIIGFSVGGFILGNQLGHQAGQRDAKTQEYASQAAQEIESTCVGLGGSRELECIISVIEATNAHERAENDLIAQKNMARWSLWMLLSTVAMAGITALGVYYIWHTLVATQKMAMDSLKIGSAQSAAYLSVESCKTTFEDDRINVVTGIRNMGSFPCRNARMLISLQLIEGGDAFGAQCISESIPEMYSVSDIDGKSSSEIESEFLFERPDDEFFNTMNVTPQPISWSFCRTDVARCPWG
ncbi:MAG: hypothetical protein AAF700_07085 [Pseudomonadota bacterium]